MYGILFIVSMVLLVFGIIAVIAAVAFHVTWLYTVYAGFAALLFMVYLAVDVQVIFGKLGEGQIFLMNCRAKSFFNNTFSSYFQCAVSHELR